LFQARDVAAALERSRQQTGISAGLINFVFVNHLDGARRTFFRANAASLAEIVVDYDGDGPGDDPFGAIGPAKKAGFSAGF
jgi:hypothetical protein